MPRTSHSLLSSLVVLALSFVASARAQSVLSSITFDSFTPGPGQLIGTDKFHMSIAGTALAGLPSSSDPLSGIAASSPLGTGQAGYLGGGGTNAPLTSSNGSLFVRTYPTSITINLGASPTPIQQASVDFVVQRNGGTNSQYFFFDLYDDQHTAYGTGNAYHSDIVIGPSNEIVFYDAEVNGASSTPTGITIVPGRSYNLTMQVDYTSATWSASLLDFVTGATIPIAANRSVDVGGFNLSGYTGTAGLDVGMGGTVSSSNHGLADRIYFDNYTTAAIPEPSTTAWILGSVVLVGCLVTRVRKRGSLVLVSGLLAMGIAHEGKSQTVIFSNLGNSAGDSNWTISGPSSSTGQFQRIAISFTPSADYYLTAASVPVASISGFNGITIGMYSAFNFVNGDSIPSSALEEVSVANLPSVFTFPDALTSVAFSGQTNLSAGSTYWLVVSPGESDSWLAWKTAASGGSNFLIAPANPDGWYYPTFRPEDAPAATIYGVAAIPEPATTATIIGTFAAVGGLLWRRSRAPGDW